MRLREIRSNLAEIARGLPYLNVYEYPAGGEALPAFIVLGLPHVPTAWPNSTTSGTAALQTVTAVGQVLVSAADMEQLYLLDDIAQDLPPLFDAATATATYGWNSVRVVSVGEYGRYDDGDTPRLGAQITVEVML